MKLLEGFIYEINNGCIKGVKKVRDQYHIKGNYQEISMQALSNTKATSIIIDGNVKKIGHLGIAFNDNLEYIVINNPDVILGKSCFYANPNLKGVMLPENLKVLSDSAFSLCSSLEVIKIPQTVTCIEDRAFEKCESLKNIRFPLELNSIGRSAFENCKNIDAIYLKNTLVNVLSDRTFADCSNLSKVIFNSKIKSIGDGCFLRCSDLRNIIFPASLRKIKANAFNGSGLKSFSANDGLLSIYDGAFKNCESLTSVVLNDNLVELGEEAFACCDVKEVKIGSKLTVLNKGVFKKNHNLEKIVIPKNINKISSECFAYCEGLKEIVIENPKIVIEDNAFLGCYDIENIKYKDIDLEVGCFSFYDLTKKDLDFMIKNKKYIDNIHTKIKIPLKSYKQLTMNNLHVDFINNSYMGYYQEVAEAFASKNNITIERFESLFGLTYHLGVFNKEYGGKIKDILIPLINDSTINASNIVKYWNEDISRACDLDIVKDLVKDNTLEDILKYIRDYPELLSYIVSNYKTIKEYNLKGNNNDLKSSVEMIKKMMVSFNGDEVSLNKKYSLIDELTKFYDINKSYYKAKGILNKHEELKVNESLIDKKYRIDSLKDSIKKEANKFISSDEELARVCKKIWYELVDKNDPSNFTLGKYMSCENCLGGKEESSCIASIMNPLTQTLVLKNSNTIVASATFSLNLDEKSLIIDKFNINKNVEIEVSEIGDKFMSSFIELVTNYNKENDSAIEKIYVSSKENIVTDYLVKDKKIEFIESIDYSKYSYSGYKGSWQDGVYLLTEKKYKNTRI